MLMRDVFTLDIWIELVSYMAKLLDLASWDPL